MQQNCSLCNIELKEKTFCKKCKKNLCISCLVAKCEGCDSRFCSVCKTQVSKNNCKDCKFHCLTCSTSFVKCSGCLKPHKKTCLKSCSHCSLLSFCKDCASKKLMVCSSCQRDGCSKCLDKCLQCNLPACFSCSGSIRKCNLCTKRGCFDCLKPCIICSFPAFCSSCFQICDICKSENICLRCIETHPNSELCKQLYMENGYQKSENEELKDTIDIQNQEIVKLKNLLLEKEKENENVNNNLKVIEEKFLDQQQSFMNKKECKKLLKKIKKDSKIYPECVVCLNSKAVIAAIPCGHLIFCTVCATECASTKPTSKATLKNNSKFCCPVCRLKVKEMLRIYF